MKMVPYEVSSETTITGTVEDVLQPHMGRMMGTHLIVKTATETIEVHVGPSDFVTKEGFTFAKGDSIQVLGSKVTIDGKEALISREVTKDGKTLTLARQDRAATVGGPQIKAESMLKTASFFVMLCGLPGLGARCPLPEGRGPHSFRKEPVH